MSNTDPPALAQTVEGSVFDAATAPRSPGVQVDLLNGTTPSISSATSNFAMTSLACS